jgi:hypothetical protein
MLATAEVPHRTVRQLLCNWENKWTTTTIRRKVQKNDSDKVNDEMGVAVVF